MAVFKPYGPPTVPSPDTILQGLKGTKSQVAMVFPSFLEVRYSLIVIGQFDPNAVVAC